MSESSCLGVAIIGLGTVGRRFVEQFGKNDGFTVIGGFDLNADARARAEADFGIATAIDAIDLMSNPDVDVVYIATPPLFHEQYVDQVQAAGKAIFCEKPLGVDNTKTQAMVKRIENAGTRAGVNFVFGAAPSAIELVNQVAAGACGVVTGVDLRLHFCRWPRDWQAEATWLRDRNQGGWVREVVSHYVFLITRLFGPASILDAHVGFPTDGSSEQSLAALLDCAGTPVRLVGTSDAAGADEVEFTVRGTEQSFRLTNWYQLAAATSDSAWQPVLSDEAVAPPASYAAQLGELTAMVSGNDHTLSTFAEAYAVQELVEALLGHGDR